MASRLSSGSLRNRLLLLISLAFTPVLVTIIFTLSEQRGKAAAEAQAAALRVLHQVEAAQERQTEAARQFLIAMAQVPKIHGPDWEECSSFAADLLQHYPQYSNLGVGYADGTVTCSGRPTTSPIPFEARSALTEAAETARFTAGKFILLGSAKTPALIFAYPVPAQGGAESPVVFAAFNLELLTSIPAQQGLPAGTTLTLIDPEGTVVIREPESEKWRGKSLQSAPIIKQILSEGRENTSRAVGMDGRERLFAYGPFFAAGTKNGFVSLGIPTEAAFAEANRHFAQQLAGLSLALLFAAAVVWLGAEGLIGRPVRAILTATRRLAMGEMSARTGVASDATEVSRLATAFDEMASTLQRREAEADNAQAARRDSDARFRTLVENSPDVIMLIDRDATIRFINHTLPKDRVDQLIGTKATAYMTRPDSERSLNILDSVFETRQPGSLEVSADGPSVWMVRVVPVMSGDDVQYAMVIATEISELREAEENLTRSVSLLQATLDSTADGILVVDLEGRIVSFNRQFSKMWQIPDSILATGDDNQAIGYVLDQLNEPEQFLKKVRELYAEHDAESYDILEFRNGRIFERFSQPQRLDGKPIGRVWSFHDVTVRHRIDEALRRSAEELEAKVAERTSELEEVNATLASFAFSVSHDLRAPLRMTQALVFDLIEEGGTSVTPACREKFDQILSATYQMDKLIQDILTYSRLSREQLLGEPLPLSAIFDEVMTRIGEGLADRGATVTIAPDLPAVQGHHTTVAQTIVNLMANAVKFVSPGVKPVVNVRADRRGDRVRVWFEDNGIGIAPDDHERIFGLFERLHPSDKYPGTGIGLAIVRKGIERLNGEVGVESELGQGSRFWFELPAASEKT